MELGFELFKATFGGVLPYIMGLTIAIEAGIMILQGATAGLATLIIPMIAMIVVNAFIEDVNVPGNKYINTEFTFSELTHWIINNIWGNDGNSENTEKTTISVIIGGIATVLSLTGYMLSWGVNAISEKYGIYKDKTVKELVGEGSSITAILLGIFGVILSAATASNEAVLSSGEKHVLSLWSGVIGAIGMIFSIVGAVLNPSSLGLGGYTLKYLFYYIIISCIDRYRGDIMEKQNKSFSQAYNNLKKSLFIIFFIYDSVVGLVLFILFIRNFIIVSSALFLLLILFNWIYFHFLFNLKAAYMMKIVSNDIFVITKKGKVLAKLDICTLVFPVINLKKEWWGDFVRNNKGVSLYLHDRKGNKYVIGKGILVYGHMPMSEAMDVEKWLQKQKEKICEK